MAAVENERVLAAILFIVVVVSVVDRLRTVLLSI